MNVSEVTRAILGANELTLTCKGMSVVNWDCSDPDFEFIFGEDRVCHIHSVLAEFLSPKVARLRRCDPLCSFYAFKDSEMFNVLEHLVAILRSGDTVRVEQSNFLALLRLAQELENSELFDSLLGMINTESLNLEEAISLLQAGIDIGAAFSARFGNLKDFIASHFHELKKEILDGLDLETTQILLASASLQIEDEDSLYDFVRSRSENDLRFTSLFEFVYFDYLSVNRIEDFVSFLSENLLEKINSGIWRQICRRLILDTKLKEQNPHNCRSNSTGNKGTTSNSNGEFVYNESKKPDGIIELLSRRCGGNVHDRGFVTVTASSVYSRDYPPKSVVDLGKNSEYASADWSNQWICYDFKYRRVIPTSYSVTSYNNGPGANHLRSWVIEVSNDGTENSWREIDRRDNDYNLNGALLTVNFEISHVPRESFRFLRLRQTGKNHRGFNYLNFSGLEIFGTLFE